ncbi:hypothetical protein KKD52_17095 [Myxococcota bacterium]|nr:hypothetical protein [Myxococcota bacterium]MBU1413457.1 hypothetical protein [Myxococcota bacterium]MBU1512072.1 hypothetical protein [Myxococcota bacterium]
MKHIIKILLALVSAALLGSACQLNTTGLPENHLNNLNNDAGTDADIIDAEPDADADAMHDPIVVATETRTYPVAATPANPVSGETAPSETQFIRVQRYYAENPWGPTRAIVLAYPGAQLGAGSYRTIAETLIERSGGTIELWAYERRGNLLEDRTGVDAALASGDASLAFDYYGEGLEIDGKTFGGVIPGDTPTFMSEWGLAQEAADLKMVLDFIPEDRRKSSVILMGFSLGSPVIGQFAAWDFDGKKASDYLAGVVMLDGGGLRRSLTEDQYHEEGCVGSLGLKVGLDQLREAGPYVQELGLDSGIWIALDLAALRASGRFNDPRDEVQDRVLKNLIGIFLDKPDLRLTARAALSVLADDNFAPAIVMRAGLGMIEGGPVEEYHSELAGETLLRPSSTEVLYSWLDYDQTDPPELSSVEEMAELILSGPTGAMEWYSPVRLNLDVCACDGLDVRPSDDDYRWRMGMRVTRNAEMDAPVLFFFAEYGEIWDLAFINNYMNSLPPVGPGRPNAGAERDPALPPHLTGFSRIIAPRYHHMDSILAAPETGNDYLYEPLLDFILANTEGTVSASLP